jgi:hypothetical protein
VKPPRSAIERGGEDDYTLDDLIADERRQSRFTLIIFILAVLFFGGRELLSG